MGMYTGLRVKAYIKPEFAEMVSAIVNRDAEWKDFDYPFLEEFKVFSRARFIPFGAMSYMPEDWYNDNGFDIEQGVWNFACSLKNYEGEIDKFLEDVLPNIAITATAERLYEEEAVSALYEISEGVIVETRESVWEGY